MVGSFQFELEFIFNIPPVQQQKAGLNREQCECVWREPDFLPPYHSLSINLILQLISN